MEFSIYSVISNNKTFIEKVNYSSADEAISYLDSKVLLNNINYIAELIEDGYLYTYYSTIKI